MRASYIGWEYKESGSWWKLDDLLNYSQKRNPELPSLNVFACEKRYTCGSYGFRFVKYKL